MSFVAFGPFVCHIERTDDDEATKDFFFRVSVQT